LAIGGHKKNKMPFFATIKKLNAFGFDLKYELENKHVIVEECWFCLGDLRFKIKSHGLKLEYMVGMEDIYLKVFGTTIVMNNEVFAWIV
jgi:hypothetical protein